MKLAGKRRILVIGCSGAGKTTLALRLGDITGLPVVHLDREFWRPGWQPTPDDEWERRVEELLVEPAWILDGVFSSTLARRLPRADLAVWVDPPHRVCLFRIARRVALGWGRTRPDLASDCPEHLDLGFFRWVWRWPRDVRPGYERAIAESDTEVVHLRSSREVDEWTRRIDADA